MRAPQFTPGPWECESENERPRPWIGRLDENRFAALACGDDDTEAWANGRLIAAAPELYEVCVDTLDALNRLRDGFELSPRNAVRDAALLMIDQHVDLLETALFKARGESGQ